MFCIQNLEKVSGEILDADCSDAISQPNIPKNRYQKKIPCKQQRSLNSEVYTHKNVADSHNQVHLKPSAAPGSDYINASFVEVVP